MPDLGFCPDSSTGCSMLDHQLRHEYYLSGMRTGLYSPAMDGWSSQGSMNFRHVSPAVSDLSGFTPGTPSTPLCFSANLCHMPSHTIAMPEVQRFSEFPSEACYEPYIPYDNCIPEGYFPIDEEYDCHAFQSTNNDERCAFSPNTTTASPVESPMLRQRKPAARSTTRVKEHRVSKRKLPRRSVTAPTTIEPDSDVDNALTRRPFSCPLAPYGCHSTFGSKNEWKRHFSSQHLRLGYWRCDQCPALPNRNPNDFNRRDLFMQHVRRMHGHKTSSTTARRSRKRTENDEDEAEVLKAAARCYRQLRSPPVKSICIICEERFSGPNSWEKRMEHLGRHFEDNRKDTGERYQLAVESWKPDECVEKWMLAEGILTTDQGSVAIADDFKE